MSDCSRPLFRSPKRPEVTLTLVVLVLLSIFGAGVMVGYHFGRANGWRECEESIERRGGMRPETKQRNLEHGREILDGM